MFWDRISSFKIYDSRKYRTALGAAALLFFSVHGAYLFLNHEAAHLLWTCHIGSAIIGLGLIASKPRPVAVGVLWLGFGDILWFIYLAGGGDFDPTSPLTHIGGLVIGAIGLHKMGIPRQSWLWALLSLVMLQQVSRWATPAAQNVNLAFRVHEGWEKVFPSYGVYLAVLLTVSGLFFWGGEKVLRKIIQAPRYGRR